jgi:hypothetical protein
MGTLGYPQSTHWKISLQTPFSETPQREIQCNHLKNSLYSSSCSHVATFLLVLAQKLPHLMGRSSITCNLVAHLMEYLKSHLLQACTMRWGPYSKRRKSDLRWTSQAGPGKIPWAWKCALEYQRLCSSWHSRDSNVAMGLPHIDWGYP